ncbi:MAG TPA: diiron oxygenase, partial [Polyangiales bacterium]|nr:diiron oxygenase [Polyangiales bacterium]
YFPELFFIAVLGGEIFIDRQNRDELRRPKAEVHPLIRRILQIHVTEEARHVCFAEQYLKKHLPQLSATKRATLKLLAPILLMSPAHMMLVPSARLVRQFAIPRVALKQAFGAGSEHRMLIARTVEPIRALAEEHGFWWRSAWQRLGLVSADHID